MSGEGGGPAKEQESGRGNRKREGRVRACIYDDEGVLTFYASKVVNIAPNFVSN